jgi:hypothetical protein
MFLMSISTTISTSIISIIERRGQDADSDGN